jgi:transcriptional regulator with XRE-family HTH domain
MDLALEVGVSARHLSFVETGRSRPSPELLLAVAHHLDVPLRERNALLLAAGYAPRYQETSLNDAAMGRVRVALQRLLDTHDPYPGVAIDRMWNVVLSNRAATLLLEGVPDHVLGPPMNVFRLCLHPDGLARRTLNFAEWSAYLLGELRRAAVLSSDPELARLVEEVSQYPDVSPSGSWRDGPPGEAGEPTLLVPLRLDMDGVELSLFTTLTTFGTPQDITLSELAVELFFPADEPTDAVLRDTRQAAPA